MTAYLSKRRGTPPFDRRRLLRRAQRLLGALDQTGRELSILLCGDEEIRDLNRRYRGRDKPTDVLSFSQLEGQGGALQPAVLGDVVISLPTAARQAARRGADLFDEVQELLVHGVLHLLGHEHVDTTRARAAAMRREQARLVSLLSKPGTR